MADTTDQFEGYNHPPTKSIYDENYEEEWTFKDGFLEWLPLIGVALVIAIPFFIWVDHIAAYIILGFSAFFFGGRCSVAPKDRFPI